MVKWIASMVVVPAVALADEPRIEVGGALGAHAFSSSSELGVDDLMSEAGVRSSVALGGRAAFIVRPRFAAQGELLAIPTSDSVDGDRTVAFGVRAHARIDLLEGRIRPFLVAGLGFHALRSSSVRMRDDLEGTV